MTQVYNFSSGPAMLPVEVLRRAEQELCNWHGLGTSVMEISHRSKEFIAVAEQAEQDLRDLLKVPSNYKVLFCHGGARAQFAALPLNLLGDKASADYIDGGYWAHSAIKEAEKYCAPNVIDVKTRIDGLSGIKPMKEWQLSADAAYVHYCPNETIDGVAIDETPDFGDKVVIGDYSSTILSRPLDVSRFGVIYAGAQKNIGPAGLTLVIVRDDLLGKARKEVPSILDYTVLAENDSMFNTPPTFAWYLSGLVFKWLKEQGGWWRCKNAIRPRPNCCTRPSINPTFTAASGDRQPFPDERAVPAGRCGAGQGVPQRGRSHRPAGAEKGTG